MAMRCVAVLGLLLAPAAAFTTSTNRFVAPVSRSTGAGGMTMKIFDWKRREANEDCESPHEHQRPVASLRAATPAALLSNRFELFFFWNQCVPLQQPSPSRGYPSRTPRSLCLT
jgi:hypothetical protein